MLSEGLVGSTRGAIVLEDSSIILMLPAMRGAEQVPNFPVPSPSTATVEVLDRVLRSLDRLCEVAGSHSNRHKRIV